MKPRTKKILLLLFIFSLAFILRFYKLGIVPDGLQQDESSLGYNAYSILLTGRDEHGVALPQNFQAFGEYKLPGYIYASVWPIYIFGLNPFAIRFVSALSGFLSVVVVYFLTKTLIHFFRSDPTVKESRLEEYLPYVTAFLVAINPSHLQFSRAAFEVMLANFFILSAVLLFLRGIKKSETFIFFFSAIFFSLSIYTYNIARIFVPLLVIALFIVFWKDFFSRKKGSLILFALTFLVCLAPFVIGVLTKGGADSTLGTLIFSSAKVQAPLLEFRSYFVDFPTILNKLLFNSWLLTLWQYLQNVAANLSIPFFFIKGSGNGIDGIGTTGQWYLFELPLVVLGLLRLWKEKSKGATIILFWILSLIFISGFTREPPQVTRTFFFIFPVTLCSGFGLIQVVRSVIAMKNNYLQRVIIGVSSVLVVYFIFLYFASYYYRFPIYFAKNWRTGDRDVAAFIKSHENNYDKILIDEKSGFIYTSLLTYLPFSPREFQSSAIWKEEDSEGFTRPVSFGKYLIKDIDWTKDLLSSRTLIVTTVNNKPLEVVPKETIYYPLRPVVINVGQEIMQFPTKDDAYVLVDTGNLR